MSVKFDLEVVERIAFKAVGIQVRTNNAIEMTGAGKIGDLWQSFYSENVLEKIPLKKNENIISMYTNYESDVNGEYSYFIGVEVDHVETLPEALSVIEVPSLKYAKFTSRKGKGPDVVIELWKHIWHLTEEGKVDRAYIADFDIYDERAKDPGDMQVDVFLSIN